MKTQRITASLALIVALVAVPALSGCSIQQLVENATGGNVSLPGQSVPDDFPKEVPLIDGEVIFGLGIGDETAKGWNVTIKVSGLDAADQIKSELEGAGFTASDASLGGATADGATLIYDNGTYNVLVVVSKDTDNGFVASYTVASTPK